MFPPKAVKKLKPTHQIIHTKVGAKLELGACAPRMPLSMTSRKSATDRRRRPNRPGGKQRSEGPDLKEIEARVTGQRVSLSDEQTDLDKGDQHHRGSREEVEPKRERKVLALPEPVSESLAGQSHTHEEQQREDQDDKTAHNSP